MDSAYFKTIRQRVSLARQINTIEHRRHRAKSRDQWLTQSAKALDIELDEDLYPYSSKHKWRSSSIFSKMKTFIFLFIVLCVHFLDIKLLGRLQEQPSSKRDDSELQELKGMELFNLMVYLLLLSLLYILLYYYSYYLLKLHNIIILVITPAMPTCMLALRHILYRWISY